MPLFKHANKLFDAIENDDASAVTTALAETIFLFFHTVNPNALGEHQMRPLEWAILTGKNEQLIDAIRKAGGASRFNEAMLKKTGEALVQALAPLITSLVNLMDVLIARGTFNPKRIEPRALSLEEAWHRNDLKAFEDKIRAGERPDDRLFLDASTKQDKAMITALMVSAPRNLLTLQYENGDTLFQRVNRGTVVKMTAIVVQKLKGQLEFSADFIEELRTSVPSDLETVTAFFDRNFERHPGLKDKYQENIRPQLEDFWDAAKSPFHKMLEKFSAQTEDQRNLFCLMQTGNTTKLKQMLSLTRSCRAFSTAPKICLSAKTFCGLTPTEIAYRLGEQDVLKLFISAGTMREERINSNSGANNQVGLISRMG